MVGAVKVNIIGVQKVKTLFGRVGRFPQLTIDTTRKWGKILERDTKTSARQAGIKRSSGTLFGRGIRWDQKPNGRIGTLFVRQYGVFLDSMRPHWVSMRKGRGVLLRWAETARSSKLQDVSAKIQGGTIKNHGIFVKPHPYLRTGFNRARPKLTKLIKANVTTKGGK